MGVSRLAWSPDGRLLASVNDNTPSCVWVWDVGTASLGAVLVQLDAVRDMAWAPAAHAGAGGAAGPTLALTTGCGRVFVWTRGGASIVHVPLAGFAAAGVAWGPGGGGCMVLQGREAFCCAYVADA
jgi:hypothetical protein